MLDEDFLNCPIPVGTAYRAARARECSNRLRWTLETFGEENRFDISMRDLLEGSLETAVAVAEDKPFEYRRNFCNYLYENLGVEFLNGFVTLKNCDTSWVLSKYAAYHGLSQMRSIVKANIEEGCCIGTFSEISKAFDTDVCLASSLL